MDLKEHLTTIVDKINGKHIEEIKEIIKNDYEAKVKYIPEENLFVISYDMIKTPFSKKGSLALRGTIFELNENDIFEGKVVCLPFYKFFNHGEKYSFKGNPEDVKAIYSKEDGSLIKLYYHDNKWKVASNNTPNAYKCDMCGVTLGELFDKAIINYDFDFNKLNKDYIYCLELATPQNQIVLKYNEYTLFHLMTRCMKTLNEVYHNIGIPEPKNYKFENIENVLSSLKNIKEKEGYVIVYNCGNRIKIKSEWYVLNHHSLSKTNLTDPKFLLKCIISENIDDIINPTIEPDVEKLKIKLINFENKVQEIIEYNNLVLPITNERKVDLYRSGIIKTIENDLVRSAFVGLITNKIKSCKEILSSNDKLNELIKSF